MSLTKYLPEDDIFWLVPHQLRRCPLCISQLIQLEAFSRDLDNMSKVERPDASAGLERQPVEELSPQAYFVRSDSIQSDGAPRRTRSDREDDVRSATLNGLGLDDRLRGKEAIKRDEENYKTCASQKGRKEPKKTARLSYVSAFSAWKARAEPRQSWLVLFFSVVPVNVLLGMDYIINGIFFVEYAEYFELDMAVVSLIITVKIGVMCICNMVSSVMVKLFPVRIACMCGGVLLFIGQLLTSFAPNIYALYITYGIFPGISFNLCFIATNFIIQKHFDANRALGIGCSALGFSIGTLIGAPLITVFMRTYCWRGASLIMSALFSHIVAFGWFCKEPESVDDKKLKKSGHFQRRDKDGRAEVSGYENKAMIFDDLTGREVKMTEHCEEKVERSEPSSISENRNTEQTSPSNRSDDETRVNEYDNSEDKVKERSCVVLSVKTLGKHVETSKNKSGTQMPKGEQLCQFERRKSTAELVLMDILDFSLLKKPRFVLLLSVATVASFSSATYTQHFPRKVTTLGMWKEDVAFFMSMSTISIITSRLFTTLSVNLSFVNKKTLYACGIVLMGVGCCLTVIHSFGGLTTSSVILGIGIGVTDNIIFLLLVDISGVLKYPKAIALYCIMLSLGQMAIAPVSGYIYDVTHNYDVPFVLVGSLTILAGIVQISFTVIECSRQTSYQLKDLQPAVNYGHFSQAAVEQYGL